MAVTATGERQIVVVWRVYSLAGVPVVAALVVQCCCCINCCFVGVVGQVEQVVSHLGRAGSWDCRVQRASVGYASGSATA